MDVQVSFIHYLELPHELQVLIVRYILADDPSEYLAHLGNGERPQSPLEAKREQLKPWRFVSRAFHDAVTPAIFGSIHLHASELSFARAHNVGSSRLAKYVKEIVWHEGNFSGLTGSCDLLTFKNTLDSHRRRNDYPRELRSIDLDSLYQNFQAERDAANDLRYRTKGSLSLRTLIQNLLHALPNLQTFVCMPFYDDWHDPETSAYVLRRTGHSYLPRSFFATEDKALFLSAMADFKPCRLNLSLCHFNDLEVLISPLKLAVQKMATSPHSAEKHLIRETGSFCRLTHLKVGSLNGTTYGFWTGASSQNLQDDFFLMLQSAISLRQLELSNEYPMTCEGSFLPPNNLPKLETLIISKGDAPGQWSEVKLAEAIESLAPSLLYLHFDKITIIMPEPDNGREEQIGVYDSENLGSLVRLLCRVRASTSLRSCTGIESVRNMKLMLAASGDSYKPPGTFTIESKPPADYLARKMAQAVCHEIPWPDMLGAGACGAYEDGTLEASHYARISYAWEESS